MPRRGAEQLVRILETLARVELTDGLPLPALIGAASIKALANGSASWKGFPWDEMRSDPLTFTKASSFRMRSRSIWKPSSSRAYAHASRMRVVSIVTVVSPNASFSATKPGNAP